MGHDYIVSCRSYMNHIRAFSSLTGHVYFMTKGFLVTLCLSAVLLPIMLLKFDLTT